MKIHLTGTYWHGAITFNLERAFRDLGHDVLFFDKNPQKRDLIFKNILLRVSKKKFGVERMFDERRSREWLESVLASNPDLILIEDAPGLLAEFVKDARAIKKPMFYYMTSPPHGHGGKEMMRCFEYVDEMFSIDEEWSKIAAQFYTKNPIHHLPLAATPKDFFRIAGTAKKYDAAYIASVPEQSPDGLMRAHLVDQIPEKYSVAVLGNGWNYWLKYFPRLKSRILSSSSIPISQMNEIFNKSKIVINFHSTGHTASISARTFESALAGTFQIADYRKDFDVLLPSNSVPIFSNLREMNELIEYWSFPAREKEREEKTHKLREHVLANHTWEHRANEILTVYERYRKF
ncbi:MAG: glycosyltransferase [Patescibacteria group bacterium]